MKKLLTLLFVLACTSAFGQVLSTRYYWSDSIRVTTTPVDCTFTDQWEQVSFWSDSCNVYYRAGAPDTYATDTKPRQLLYEGQVKSFGPATPLKRLIIQSAADSGIVWIEGYKRVRQQ